MKLAEHDLQLQNYQRIEKAIGFLRANFRQQPSLSEVAEHVHLSEYHFQKIFTEWAGISPKQFSKYLTLDYAKRHLVENSSMVETALASGLSGTGRLHDLFVTMEAVTPGEFKRMGENIEIRYGYHTSIFGLVFVAVTDRGICQLTFADQRQEQDPNQDKNLNLDPNNSALEQLKNDWPKACLIHDQATTETYVTPLFSKGMPDIKVLAKGTNFQIQVWQALLRLPYGATTSYQTIANAIGKPKAVRAVASAIGSNPLAYLIPCHRVLRGTGELGGYRWGLDRKSALLGWEATNLDVAQS